MMTLQFPMNWELLMYQAVLKTKQKNKIYSEIPVLALCGLGGKKYLFYLCVCLLQCDK